MHTLRNLLRCERQKAVDNLDIWNLRRCTIATQFSIDVTCAEVRPNINSIGTD